MKDRDKIEPLLRRYIKERLPSNVDDTHLNHWIFFLRITGKIVEVIHAVAFESYPSDDRVEHAKDEVRNDPEFGLGDMIDDLKMMIVSNPLH